MNEERKSQTMRFTRVIIEGRRAYCQLWNEVLCYEPQHGVHVLGDPTGRHRPETPRLWLGELPDEGWQHDLPVPCRSTSRDAEGDERARFGSPNLRGEGRAEGDRPGAEKGGRA